MMKAIMKTTVDSIFASAVLTLVLAATAVFCASPALAQAPPASVHGTVTDPTGIALTKGDVKFATSKAADEKSQKFVYSFPLDANGAFKGTGIAPGTYLVIVVQDDKFVDFQENMKFASGEDKLLNFDMTREEYMKSLTPERRKEIEDFRKKNAEVNSTNKVIANLNATLGKARAALTAAAAGKDDVSSTVSDMQQATAAKPDEGILWFVYGDALQAQGDHLAKADRTSGKPALTDPDVLKAYSDAADAYKKSADLNAASKKPDANTQSSAYNQMGLAMAKSGKLKEASDALDMAAKLEPANAGMYFGNEAAILFNSNQAAASLVAANKAIAADPTRADPYFIKGQALIGDSTVDPKTQKPVAPPGCIEAYQTYLSLEPNGKQAATVKEILAAYDVKIDTSFKAPTGKKKN